MALSECEFNDYYAIFSPPKSIRPIDLVLMTLSFPKFAGAALILLFSSVLQAQVTRLEIDGRMVSSGSGPIGTGELVSIEYDLAGSRKLSISSVFDDFRCLTRDTNESPQTTGSTTLVLDQINPDETDAEYAIADDGGIGYDLANGILSITTTTDLTQQLECFSLRNTGFSSSGFENLIRVDVEAPPSPLPAGSELVLSYAVTNTSETLIVANVQLDFVTTSGIVGIGPALFSEPTTPITLGDGSTADRWTIDLLYPGETRDLGVSYVTEPTAPSGSEIRTEIVELAAQDRTETSSVPPGTDVPIVSSVIVGTAEVTVDKVQTGGPNCLTNDNPPVPCVTAADQTLDYSITVENVGTISQTNPLMVDTLPDGSPGPLSGPSGSGVGDNELDPGEVWTYTGSYTTTQDDIDAGNDLINTASFVSDQLAFPVEGSAITKVDATATGPSLALASDLASVDAAGETVTFTLEISNSGGGQRSLTGISISAPPPSAAGGAGLSFTRTIGIGDEALNPGETWVYEATYSVTQNDIDAGDPLPVDDELSTRARVTVNELPGDFFSNLVDVDIVPIRSLALSKNITANATFANVGDVISYSFDVTNDGNQTLAGTLTIDDPLTIDESCSALSGGTLDVGETEVAVCTASYTVAQPDLDAGSIANTATVTLDGLESNEAQVTANANQQPGLEVSAIRSTITDVNTGAVLTSYQNVGDVISYEFDVVNNGNVTLAGPLSVDADPAINENCPDLSTAGNANGTLDPGVGEVITCTAQYAVTQPDLDFGSVETTVTAQATLGAQPLVSSIQSDLASANQMPFPIVQVSDSVVDVDQSGTNTAGDEIEYSFTFINAGNVTLENIEVTVLSSDGAVTVTGGPIASIAPGDSDSTSISATRVITAGDLGGNFSVTFRITIDGLSPQGELVTTSL